ncbi:BH2809 unknown [Marinilactibacillus psychrotolerans 42ea]|uniref:Uncharacterized protein n=2 Tax=Marinilactibacillus psychrotolerans TaxID=191770 RepID=A0A1R4K7X9_9LACT|nr:BH2809 unknown [Marinilactibacillus psychrotolerans 42ea]
MDGVNSMKKVALINWLLGSVLMISGCSLVSVTDKSDKKQMDTMNVEKSKKEEAVSQKKTDLIDFEEEFQPPHFQVEDFSISNTVDEKMHITIDYTFDQELFDFMKSNSPEYYYLIEYPTQLVENTNLVKSDIIKGVELDESSTQMTYSIEIEEEIPEGFDIDSLMKEPTGFQLFILNKDKDPIHIIDDIYYYSDYDPDLSQTIVE